jgi:3-oxoacyl-[acyl-carrier protein] reductase
MNILITGGSSGLGEAITRKLAQDKSHHVYFTYNQSLTNAQAIEAELVNTTAIKCNFANSDEVAFLCNQLSDWDIDVLINNAYSGSFINTHFHKIPIDDFASGFNENILPVISITQAAINVFRKKKAGKIITILSSAITETPPVGTAIYIANKAYLYELVKIWAVENAKFNITSNAISPSFMLTGFTAALDERVVDQIKNTQPQNQLLTTRQAAESVAELLKKGPEINGTNLVINAATQFI